MTKSKTKTTHKKTFFSIHKKVILLGIIVIFLSIWILTPRTQSRPTSQTTNDQIISYTDRYSPNKDISFNSTLEYQIPAGWNNISDNSYSLIIRKGELKKSENGPPYLDGADIVVYVHKNSNKLNATEILSDIAKNNFRNNPNPQNVSRNGLSGAYQKINFERSTDYYVFANDKYYWTVSFNCKAQCPQELISERNAFLDSLIAK